MYPRRDKEQYDFGEGNVISKEVVSQTHEWTVNGIELGAISPLFSFNSHNAFKSSLLRMKIVCPGNFLIFFVKTKNEDGVRFDNTTISIRVNYRCSQSKNLISNMDWTRIYETNKFCGIATVSINITSSQNDICDKFMSENSFLNLWENPKADITIETSDGKKKRVHKNVLLASSDVFRAMWQNETLESKNNHLTIIELDEELLDVFVNYLYSGTIEQINFKSCSKMLSIADKYNINDLLVKSENVILTKLTNDNVIEAFLIADLHSLQGLKVRTTQYITENLTEIMLTKAWCEEKNASVFKFVCEDLLKRESQQVILGQIEENDATVEHSLTIHFPVALRLDKRGIHYMNIFPEKTSSHFRLKFSEETFRLFICEYHHDDRYRFDDITVKNIRFNNTLLSISEENMWLELNKWFLLEESEKTSYSGYIEISLEISYNLKSIRNKSFFSGLLTASSSTDIILESSDGTCRHVHEAVLIARNLSKMVNACDSKGHLKLFNVSLLALDAFIEFIYTDDIETFDFNSCAELLALSHFYNFPELKYKCEIELRKVHNLDNAIELLSLAHLNNSFYLKHFILDYIYANKMKIIEKESWQNCNNCDVLREVIKYYVNFEAIDQLFVNNKTISVNDVPVRDKRIGEEL